MERAEKQERVHTFNQLLEDLAERRERKFPFIYGDFVGCAIDLIVYEELIDTGMAGPVSAKKMEVFSSLYDC